MNDNRLPQGLISVVVEDRLGRGPLRGGHLLDHRAAAGISVEDERRIDPQPAGIELRTRPCLSITRREEPRDRIVGSDIRRKELRKGGKGFVGRFQDLRRRRRSCDRGERNSKTRRVERDWQPGVSRSVQKRCASLEATQLLCGAGGIAR